MQFKVISKKNPYPACHAKKLIYSVGGGKYRQFDSA